MKKISTVCYALTLSLLLSSCGSGLNPASSGSSSPTSGSGGSNGDTEGGTVYAVGVSTNALGISIPGYWKDGTWNGLVNGATADASKSSSIDQIVIK